MWIKLTSILFLSTVIFSLAGCKVEKAEPILQEQKSLLDQVLEAAKGFALGKKSAEDLLLPFDKLKSDPKKLINLLEMKVSDDETLKDFGILHLLSRGKAANSIATLIEGLLSASGDAKKAINIKAQGKTPFELLRDPSLRPHDEQKEDNLGVAQVFIDHDVSLINDETLSFSDKNYLFLHDKSKTAALFNAMDTKNIDDWENAAVADSNAAKSVLSTVMQHIGARKTTYKNKIFTRALGTALDHSDDNIASFVEEFFNHGFNLADLMADDFSCNNGPEAKFFTVYAYALQDINEDHPVERGLFVMTVEAFKKHFALPEDYFDYARADTVKATLYDQSKSSAFSSVSRPAIKSPGGASKVLQLRDSDRKVESAFGGKAKKMAQWALNNPSEFKEAFLKISDSKRQIFLRGALLDEAHDNNSLPAFIDHLSDYGLKATDEFELNDGNGDILHGPLLYVLAKRVVFAGKNNGDAVVYKDLNDAALKVKEHLADYIDHVTKALHGKAQETILDLLEGVLGSAQNIKPGYPGYSHRKLALPEKVDATVLLAASAASKVSLETLSWLYDALLLNAGAPQSFMSAIFSDVVSRKHDGNNFVHLVVEKPADPKSLILLKSFLAEYYRRAESVTLGSGFAKVQDLLFIKNKNKKSALNLLLADRSKRVVKDDPQALAAMIVELIKKGSNPLKLDDNQVEKAILVLDKALTLLEKTQAMQGILRQLSSVDGRGQAFYTDTAKLDLWLKAHAVKGKMGGFAALFSSDIEDRAKSMLKNRLLSQGLSYEKLVENHEQLKISIVDLRKSDFLSTKDPRHESTLLNVMTEAMQGVGLKKFAQSLNKKAFASTMASVDWQNYVTQTLQGKTAAEHAAPAFLRGKDKASEILGMLVKGSSSSKPSSSQPSSGGTAGNPPPSSQPSSGGGNTAGGSPSGGGATTPPNGNSTGNAGGQSQASGSSKRQQNAKFSAKFNFFNKGQQNNWGANFQQHFKQNANNAAHVGKGSVNRAKSKLEKLWNDTVLKNPARDVPVSYVRKIINMQDPRHEISKIVAIQTKEKKYFTPLQNSYDDKGLELKAVFKGVIPGSKLASSLDDAGKTLKALSTDELTFLVSQRYFWTDVLANMPHVFSLLNTAQIQAISTAVANTNKRITEEVALVLPRLIAYLDVEKDALVLEKIAVLVPAAAVSGACIEDRLREKLTVLKKIAFLQNKNEADWHAADAQVQRLDFIANARKTKSSASKPTPKDFEDAKGIIMFLLKETDRAAFDAALDTCLPSNADHDVGDALLLLSSDYHERKDLMFMLSPMQIEGIFDVLLSPDHQRSAKQTELAINLIRALDPAEPHYVAVIKGILAKLGEIKGYPQVPSDLDLLENTLGAFEGSINGSLRRYDHKSSPSFDAHEKFLLLEQFQFIKKRLSQWKKHSKDKNNQALLDKLKGQEPKPLAAPVGGFGIYGKVDNSLMIPLWFDQAEIQKWLFGTKGPFVLSTDQKELEEVRAFLAEVCSQAAFLNNTQLQDVKDAFKALLKHHGASKVLIDFIYALKSEHEAAALLELIPDLMLGELIKYLNVADNVALSVFRRIEKLSVFFFYYISKAQFDLVIADAKWWELLGAQAAAAALALPPSAFDTLADHVAQKRAFGDEGNLARMISKIDIYDAASAEWAYDRLIRAAAHAKGLKLLEKQIMQKSNALRQHLAHDAEKRVKALKHRFK